jgi:hypothetical protein
LFRCGRGSIAFWHKQQNCSSLSTTDNQMLV